MKEDSKLTEKQKRMIGYRIADALNQSGKKMKELAEHLSVTDNTVSYFCSGKRMPNLAQIRKISLFTGFSTDFLLDIPDKVDFGDIEAQSPYDNIGCSKKAYEALRSRYINDLPLDERTGVIVEAWRIVYKIILDEYISLQHRPNTDEGYCIDEKLFDLVIENLLLNAVDNKDFAFEYFHSEEFIQEQEDRVALSEYQISKAFETLLRIFIERITKRYSLLFEETPVSDRAGNIINGLKFKIIDNSTKKSIFPTDELENYLSQFAHKSLNALRTFMKEHDEIDNKLKESIGEYKNRKEDNNHAEEE